MTQQPIGRLENVDLRTVWESEASDFTPWLAKDENLKLLGEAIGLELDLEAQEQRVGPFRADIVCRDTLSDSLVLVENQLERTDHTHLGQLMTYAAGLQTACIVWIAYAFADEHRAALDWLNEITDDRFSFFGVVVEALRIGDSPVAPRFDVVAKPNNWTKSITAAVSRMQAEGMSESDRLRLEYWTGLYGLLQQRGGVLRPQGPKPAYYMNCPIGRSGFHLTAMASTRGKWIGAGLYILRDRDKAKFGALAQDRSAIDDEAGSGLQWQELPDAVESRILFVWENVDISTREGWDEQHAWLADRLEKAYRVFAPRVRELDVSQPEDEAEA